ncbi:MAG TPA: hypothetical protein VGS09_12415 [Actinomycetota bacterium]|jgi:hypothetical protein|nr:hypothetical protein [Actinomycetota bacterium]
MTRILRSVAVTIVAVWLAWNVYRHVAVYLIRGRVLVITDRVLGNLVLGAGGIGVLLSPFPADIVLLAAALAADLLFWWAEVWLVVGASPGRVLERAGVVLSGMGFSYEQTGEGALEERDGRIRLRVAVSPSGRTHLLRLRTARGINKVALFRANFRKFLLAIPRERR